MMIRVDRCEFSKFQSFKYINFAIIALYKEYLKEVKKYATQAINFFNPIAIIKYNKDDIKFLLDECLQLESFGISPVDTFGSFNLENFNSILQIFDENIPNNFTLTPKLKFSLALSFKGKRKY